MERPFSAFEEYMLLDDSPAYPMDSFRGLRFSGHVDVSLLEAAIRDTVRLHPMLRSIARPTGRGRFVWVEVDQPLFFRRVAGPIDRPYPVLEPIDLQRETGLKVYVVEEADRCAVLMQFHHSVSDGIGEMQFVGDVLCRYAALAEGRVPEENPRKLDAALLPMRISAGMTFREYLKYHWYFNGTAMRQLFRRPAPLNPDWKGDPQEPAGEYPAMRVLELSADETRRVFAAVKKRQMTVNDLLLGVLFRTISAWRRRWTDAKDQPWLRVSMPMNMRDETHRHMPAANHVTMVFLDRRPGQCEDADALLQGIHRETQWIKRTCQKYVLHLFLWVGRWLPGGLAWHLKQGKCQATCVLSNLGKVLETVPLPRDETGRIRVPGAVLEEVDAAPPIRKKTLVSLSALTYGNQIRLIMRYDHKNMTPEQADDFLRALYDELTGEFSSRAPNSTPPSP